MVFQTGSTRESYEKKFYWYKYTADLFNKFNISEDTININNNSILTTNLNGLKLQFMEKTYRKLKLTRNHELFV